MSFDLVLVLWPEILLFLALAVMVALVARKAFLVVRLTEEELATRLKEERRATTFARAWRRITQTSFHLVVAFYMQLLVFVKRVVQFLLHRLVRAAHAIESKVTQSKLLRHNLARPKVRLAGDGGVRTKEGDEFVTRIRSKRPEAPLMPSRVFPNGTHHASIDTREEESREVRGQESEGSGTNAQAHLRTSVLLHDALVPSSHILKELAKESPTVATANGGRTRAVSAEPHEGEARYSVNGEAPPNELFPGSGEVVTSFSVLSMVKEAKDEIRFGNLIRAEELLIKAIKSDPHHIEAFVTLGILYFQTRKFLDAIDALRTALKLDRTNANAKLHLASIYTLQKKYADAVALYEELIESEGRSAARFANLGDVYEAWGKYDKAIVAYQEGIRIDPRNTEVLGRLMEAALITHRNDVAQSAGRDILVVSPTHVRAREVLVQLGVPYDRPPHTS